MATLHKTLCNVAQYMQKRRKPSQILTGFTPFRYTLSIYFITPHRKMQVLFTKNVTAKLSDRLYLVFPLRFVVQNRNTGQDLYAFLCQLLLECLCGLLVAAADHAAVFSGVQQLYADFVCNLGKYTAAAVRSPVAACLLLLLPVLKTWRDLYLSALPRRSGHPVRHWQSAASRHHGHRTWSCPHRRPIP